MWYRIAICGLIALSLAVQSWATSEVGVFERENKDPAWSPDGQHIAFGSASREQAQIWLIHPDGTGLEQLTEGKNPKWAPDSHSLYFMRPGALWKRDLFTGVESPVTAYGVADHAVSHSGLELILGTMRGDPALIIASAVTGKDLRWFMTKGHDPAWSPDDSEAVCGLGGENLWIRSTVGRINRRQLTWLPKDPDGFGVGGADWSSTGFIAFHYNREICKIRPDGSDLTLVFQETEHPWVQDPSWSPDGTRLVFVRIAYPDDLWIINADGTGLTQLTHTVAAPRFSPEPGHYTDAQSVEITTGTVGAQVRYTTDGSEPTEISTLYTAPVSVTTSMTLKTRAWKTGWLPSETNDARYIIEQVISRVLNTADPEPEQSP